MGRKKSWLTVAGAPSVTAGGKSAKMQTSFGCSLSSKQIALGAKGGHTWAGNSSLSFILFVCVKIPLCPHPFSHPVPCFVHPSIRSLCQCWLHPSSHNHIVAIARPQGTPSPPHAFARSHLPLPDCDLLMEGPAGCLSFSIALASKNTNTQPDSYRPAFHLSCWGEWKRERHKERETEGEVKGGGG